MMIVTEEFLEKYKTPNGAWNAKQLALLGISWPPKKGWKRRSIGKCISEGNAKLFMYFGSDSIAAEPIRGANFVDPNCDCGIPPWEVCKHSFTE